MAESDGYVCLDAKDPNPQKRLERGQIAIYVAALTIGAPFCQYGRRLLRRIRHLPVLGVLLYATFLQVPFSELRTAFSGGRFLLTSLAVNFVTVPEVVWADEQTRTAELLIMSELLNDRRSDPRHASSLNRFLGLLTLHHSLEAHLSPALRE